MKKILSLLFLCVGALLTFLVATKKDEAIPERLPRKKMNVVIMLIDTLRADRLGAYGHSRNTSPNIDRLAQQSVVFEQAHSPAPWTLPSVMSYATTKFVLEHGVKRDRHKLRDVHPTFMEVLKEQGYFTAHFVSNPYAGRSSGFSRGVDFFKGVGKTDRKTLEKWHGSFDDTKPLFLYIHNIEPHNPYFIDDRYVKRFGGVSEQVREEIREASGEYRRSTRVDFTKGKKPGTTDNTEVQQKLLRRLIDRKEEYNLLYDASVYLADERVGSVIRFLKEKGLWEETLFILMSDHGEEIGDRGGWQHDQSLYEELIRVPYIWRFPNNMRAGQRVTQPVSLIDLAPTLFDLLGIVPKSKHFKGKSSLPLIESPQSVKSEMFISSMRLNEKKYYRPYKESRGDFNIAIRKGKWKGIRNMELNTFELYDLDVDPQERQDCSSEQEELVNEMTAFVDLELKRIVKDSTESGGKKEAGEAGELDAESVERLRSLGYM